MAYFIKDNGSYSEINSAHVKVAGTYTEAQAMYKKESGVYSKFYEKTVTGGGNWDITAATHNQTFNVSAIQPNCVSVYISDDGTKLFTSGIVTNSNINMFDLSTAWDVSTMTYNSEIDVGAQDINPYDVQFNQSGTIMFVLGYSSDSVYRYDLSTAWDLSTTSYVNSYSVSFKENKPNGFFINNDGTKMYIVGITTEDTHEFTFGTPFDLTTLTFTQSYDSTPNTPNPVDIFFNPNGLQMFLISRDTDRIKQYDLTTAWDISTASYINDFFAGAIDSKPLGLFFKPDGTKMYVSGYTNDVIIEYDL